MTDNLERNLKEFSAKHSALLLAMHQQLQNLHERVNSAEQHSNEANRFALKSARDLDVDRMTLREFKNDLASEIRQQLSSMNAELQAKQQQATALFEESLKLLREHKNREVVLGQWLKGLEIGILILFIIAVSALGYLIWDR